MNYTRKSVHAESLISSIRQGDLFFAEFVMSTGVLRSAPVLVVGSDNDPSDVVVCSCTSAPPRTDFDILVHLKVPTCVRTNKIYTIGRDQLQFKIHHKLSTQQFTEIMDSIARLFRCGSW